MGHDTEATRSTAIEHVAVPLDECPLRDVGLEIPSDDWCVHKPTVGETVWEDGAVKVDVTASGARAVTCVTITDARVVELMVRDGLPTDMHLCAECYRDLVLRTGQL